MNMRNDSGRRQLLISKAILESIGISFDELKQHIIELKSILGSKFEQLIPVQINDFPTLHWVVCLSIRLQKLKFCKGFDKHIARYSSKQIKHNNLVAGIANYLYDKVDNIELEPLAQNRRTADILVVNKGEEVYLECKGIQIYKFIFTQQHESMLSILREYLSEIPHQISITYKRQLKDEEVRRLGKSIKERAKYVKADGKLIDNPEVKVNVIKRDSFGDKRLHFNMVMIEEDLNERCRYPGDVYGIDGLSISISGPKVNYKGVLREKIRRSKHQYQKDKPYVLVIDGSTMLGELVENVRALSTAFQPEYNTRFSGAAIVEISPVIGSTRTDFTFHFVTNPFAKFPISKEFELLFKAS